MMWIQQVVGIAVLVAGSPLLWGIAQSVKARLQGRRGPSAWQMYRVIAKNWRKETTAPEFSSWIFLLAPSVSTTALLMILSMIPLAGSVPGGWPHNLLVIFFLLALERFWVGLAGLDTAGTFGGLGASRITTLGAGIEPALLAAFGVLWQITGHTAIEPLAVGWRPHLAGTLPWLLAAASFGFIWLAELGRLPVDNPDTHLELTMMHEAAILEYNGRLLAMSQWAMTLKFTAVTALGWVILGPHLRSTPANLGLLLMELLVTAAALGWAESRFTKLRYFQLPTYLAAAAGLGMVAVYLVAGGPSL
jgi:formate hydrogenlyase subunit 4